MAGNRTGGKQAAATNTNLYGADWYAKIGSLGGQASHTGGFYNDTERASVAGAIGGSMSRRGRILDDAEKATLRQAAISRLTKKKLSARRKAILRELSTMQTQSLSAKYGTPRSW
jgi:general stress protein YciG